MVNIFSKAAQGLSLTPGQRAFLKLLKGFIISAALAAVMAVLPLVQQQTVNWHSVALIGGGSFAATLLLALDKYWTAQGDAPLAAVAEEAATVVEQKTGISDVKTPLQLPPVPTATPATPAAPTTPSASA